MEYSSDNKIKVKNGGYVFEKLFHWFLIIVSLSEKYPVHKDLYMVGNRIEKEDNYQYE